MSRMAHWSCEMAVPVLRQAAQERGEAWTKAAWSQAHRHPSTATVEKLFGSWSRAWEVAGYPLRDEWTASSCLRVLRQVGTRQGRWLTMAQWDQGRYTPSVHVILRHFGHWRAAWRAAGFDPPPDRRGASGYRIWTKTAIIDALRRQARVDGTIVGMVEWQRRSYQPSMATIRKYWGSYARATQAAGLRVETDRHREMRHRRDLWKKAWMELADELGHPPSPQEWDAWPERPASARRVWPVVGADRRMTTLKQSVSGVDVDLVAMPQLRWIVAYRSGASIKEIAQAAGTTRDCIRQGLIRAVQQAQVVSAAFAFAQTLDPAHLADERTRLLVMAVRAHRPLTVVMEQSGLSARQIVFRIYHANRPVAASLGALHRLAGDLSQDPMLWGESDCVWVHKVLEAGSFEAYSDLSGEPLHGVVARAASLHAAARRKPVWVQWAREVLQKSETLLPVNLRAILEGLAAGESLRQVTDRLGQDYTRTSRKLYRLRQSDHLNDLQAAQG